MAFITEWNQTVGNFTLPLRSGYTYDFDVDYGDGSGPVHVAAYNDVNATHNYLVAGTYQISITGKCGTFYINNTGIKLKLIKIIDWGEVAFNTLTSAFKGCSNLTSLPSGRITDASLIVDLTSIFASCTKITSLPEEIFFNCTNIGANGLSYSFQYCSGLLSLPNLLVSTLTSLTNFESTFYGCSALTAIPTDFFKYNINVSSSAFHATFFGCTSLTSIPADLFKYNTLAAYSGFSATFSGCTNLTNIPIDIFRYNTLVSDYAFYQTFYNCQKLNNLPIDLFRYNTAAKSFGSTFDSNYLLSTVPIDLFRYNTAATDFSRTFFACNKLQLNKNIFYSDGEQSTRFLNKSMSFSSTFERTSFTGIIGEAPDLWNCNFGTGSANKTKTFFGGGNSLSSISNYCYIGIVWGAQLDCEKIDFINSEKSGANQLNISVACSIPLKLGEYIKSYFSDTLEGIAVPENLVSLQTTNDILFTGFVNGLITDQLNYFIQVDYYINDQIFETKNITGIFYLINQVSTTIINIESTVNYRLLTNPSHNYNHGFIFHNNYIYGSARSITTNAPANQQGIFKLKADDYSILLQKPVFENKISETLPLYKLDNIVYCQGFLWAQSSDRIIRFNLDDLDYIVFRSSLGSCNYNQPIGTDGQFLFISSDDAIQKIDTSYLLGSFESYNYNGTSWVIFPNNSELEVCSTIKPNPLNFAFLHSIQIDNRYVYLALTSGITEDVNFYFQKIDKITMQSIQSVIIPKCTDDMVQNGEFVFLAPEYNNDTNYGSSWGFLAIRKSNLEIKYLKSLHTDFLNYVDRRAYGCFYYNDKIVVQLINSKKTVLIKLDEIEDWGENYPIGAATAAIYIFQIEGVELSKIPNELVLDNNNWVHVSTWDQDSLIFKFPLSNFTGTEKKPNIQTTLIEATSDGGTVNGYIIDEGKSPITAGGFVYGTDPGNLSEFVPVTPFGSYDFDKLLTGLEPGIYYVAAYGTNTEGTFFGNTIILTIEAAAAYNSVTLKNSDTVALLRLLDGRNGCSVRCVQDAPGIATGTTGTATDIDGNVYQTVVINEKRWMIENLKTTKFRNGDAIPEITDATAWTNDLTGARCSYNNKPSLI
jgi:hypothetical protein